MGGQQGKVVWSLRVVNKEKKCGYSEIGGQQGKVVWSLRVVNKEK